MKEHQLPVNTSRLYKLDSISTDAALASSTLFAFLAQLATPDTPIVEGLLDAANSLGRLDPTSEEAADAWARAKPVIAKMLESSCDTAANILALAVTLDTILRKLDTQTPKDIVAAVYCIGRLLKDGNHLAQIQKCAEESDGKNWLWPVVWKFALGAETVRRRWMDESEKGREALLDWQGDCQKFANNYWLAKKKEFDRIEALKEKMISNLKRRLGVA